MAQIKTIPLMDLILQELKDLEAALHFLLAYFEDQVHETEIIRAVGIVASAQGLELRHANNLSAKIAAIQTLPATNLTLEHMNDLLKEGCYVGPV